MREIRAAATGGEQRIGREVRRALVGAMLEVAGRAEGLPVWTRCALVAAMRGRDGVFQV